MGYIIEYVLGGYPKRSIAFAILLTAFGFASFDIIVELGDAIEARDKETQEAGQNLDREFNRRLYIEIVETSAYVVGASTALKCRAGLRK